MHWTRRFYAAICWLSADDVFLHLFLVQPSVTANSIVVCKVEGSVRKYLDQLHHLSALVALSIGDESCSLNVCPPKNDSEIISEKRVK